MAGSKLSLAVSALLFGIAISSCESNSCAAVGSSSLLARRSTREKRTEALEEDVADGTVVAGTKESKPKAYCQSWCTGLSNKEKCKNDWCKGCSDCAKAAAKVKRLKQRRAARLKARRVEARRRAKRLAKREETNRGTVADCADWCANFPGQAKCAMHDCTACIECSGGFPASSATTTTTIITTTMATTTTMFTGSGTCLPFCSSYAQAAMCQPAMAGSCGGCPACASLLAK
mmetsp:Transcript_105116/g.279738  ORF Transcript_105116/g.279738 Transcript_105116/m.279738 type:complete len:232 (-) Transcript_105116:117-812(-)